MALPWNWVVETLAELKEADTSLLQVPITEVPDFTSNSSDSVEERIALKYLEEWLDDPEWPGPPLPSVSGSDHGIDVDRSSEEVLLLLLDKAATCGDIVKEGAELFRHDLRQFILRKRSTLPKCFVDLLKDSIHKGFSKAVPFSKEKSCLSRVDQVDYNGDQYERAKKQKLNINDDRLQLLKTISAALATDNSKAILQEDPSGSWEQSPQQNGDGLQLLKQMSAAPTADNGKKILQKDPSGSGKQSPQQNGDELQLLRQISAAPSLDTGKETFQEDPSGSGQQLLQQNVSDGECRSFARRDSGSTGGGNVQVLEPSLTPLPPVNNNKDVQHEHVSGSRKIMHPPFYRSRVADGEPSMSKTPSDGAGCLGSSFKIDQNDEMFADEKHWSSHIPLNQASMEGDKMDNVLCLKCDKGGLLLNCSSSSCSLAVHESCIESLVNFDERGHFYCPFCSYTQAALAYCRAKKRYSQAKKALETFIGKDSVRRHQEQSSHPGVLRETSRARMVGSLNCHHKSQRQQESTKTMEHHKQKEATTNCNNGNLSGIAEISQSVKRYEVSHNTAGEIDSDTAGDKHQGIMQKQLRRQTRAAVVLNNENLPCSSVHVNIDIPPIKVAPLTEVGIGIVNRCQSIPLIEHQKPAEPRTLTDNEMGEGCQCIEAVEQQIAEANAAPDNGNLACEEADTSIIEATHDVPQTNVKYETVLVETCLDIPKQKHQEQAKFVIEQGTDNSPDGKEVRPLTSEGYAKRRKLNAQTDDGISNACQKIGAVKQQLAEANAKTDNGNLTCEEGGISRIRQTRAVSRANVKSETVLIDSCLDIQKRKHRDRAKYVIEHDTHNPPDRAEVTSLTSEGYAKRRRLHDAIPPTHHPQLTSKDQNGGKSSFCSDRKGQNQSNHKSNSRRTKCYWTPEEEKALKDAMQNFSLNDKESVPWAKIWETIRDIFHEERQPGDLKDKWRNMRIKEARKQEKG